MYVYITTYFQQWRLVALDEEVAKYRRVESRRHLGVGKRRRRRAAHAVDGAAVRGVGGRRRRTTMSPPATTQP